MATTPTGSSTTGSKLGCFQRLDRANCFRTWTLVSPDQHLLASKFKNRDNTKTSTLASKADDSTKPKNSECPFKDGQHAIWMCEKFNSIELNERREHVQKFRLCLDCLRAGHRSKDCKSRTCTVPNCGRQHNKLLHSDFSKKKAITGASDARQQCV